MWKLKIIDGSDCDIVNFVILEQSAKVRRGRWEYRSPNNGYSVSSSCYPACCKSILYVRGSDIQDDNRVLCCRGYEFLKYVEVLKEIDCTVILGKVRLK